MPKKKIEEIKKIDKKKIEEIEKLIVDLAKKGMTSEKIGLKLKEKGIYVKNYGLKIGKILEKYNFPNDADIRNLEKKIERMKKHFQRHPHDYSVTRPLSIRIGKLNKLKKLRK